MDDIFGLESLFPEAVLAIGLAMTIWGAVLGLTAIFVGTLSDERTLKTRHIAMHHHKPAAGDATCRLKVQRSRCRHGAPPPSIPPR